MYMYLDMYLSTGRFYNDRSMSWFDSFIHLPIVTGATILCVRSETTVAKQHAKLQNRLIQEERCNCGLFLPYFLADLVDAILENVSVLFKFLFFLR